MMLSRTKFWWKILSEADAKSIGVGLAAHSGQISVGLSQGFSAVLIPKLLDDDFATIAEGSWIASLGVISNPLGALIAGSTAEYFGRRAAIALATLPHAAGWLLIALSTNVPMLYTGRFISGIGTGMANALYLYVTETAAPHQRAWLASSGPILVSLGVLGSYVLGALTTWQYTAAISIIPSILSLALVKFLPESPAWLARHGHLNEAKKSLLWLRGPGISYENEYKELCGDASIERRKKNSKIKLKTALLLPNVWKPFLILIIFFCLQQLSGIYIILFYAVNVLKEFGADIDEYIGSIAIGLVRLVASIIGAFLAGHFGRRPLACTSAIGMTISSILVVLSMKYNNYFLFIPKTLPIICIGCHVAFSMIGFLTLPWVLSSELYSLRFRGSLGGLTTGIAQIMTFGAIKTYPLISGNIGLDNTMMIFSISSIIGAIFSITILPETKNVTLEEIERRFSSSNFNNTNHNNNILFVEEFNNNNIVEVNKIGIDNITFDISDEGRVIVVKNNQLTEIVC